MKCPILPFAALFVAACWPIGGVAFAQQRVNGVGKSPPTKAAATPAKTPSWSELKATLEKHFADLKGRQPNDILTASEASSSLKSLEKAGWKPKEAATLTARVLGDGDFLVRELRSKQGRKFLNATGSDALVYDRLDRLSKYSGGDRLVNSIIHLPNGPSFMRPKPTPGFGTLMDLLPKGASGKTPIDPNFNKPTGKIYTSAQWIKELEAAHTAESKPAPAKPTAGK